MSTTDEYVTSYIIALTSEALLQVILVSLKSHDDIIKFLGLGTKLLAIQTVNLKGLDALFQDGLALSFQLLLRLLNFLVLDFFNLLPEERRNRREFS